MQKWSMEESTGIVRSFYRGILGRDPDPSGLEGFSDRLASGEPIESILRAFVYGNEFIANFIRKMGIHSQPASDKFPLDYTPALSEAGKSYHSRRRSGFFEKYMSGEKVIDIGYKGYNNPELRTAVPHAIGVDLDFPGYDGVRLPFDEGTIDCVFSSHCLEHISSYQEAIRDWYRVLKIGGFMVCAVPSQMLYEKRRKPPSKFNADHKRFYSLKSLLGEFEEFLK